MKRSTGFRFFGQHAEAMHFERGAADLLENSYHPSGRFATRSLQIHVMLERSNSALTQQSYASTCGAYDCWVRGNSGLFEGGQGAEEWFHSLAVRSVQFPCNILSFNGLGPCSPRSGR